MNLLQCTSGCNLRRLYCSFHNINASFTDVALPSTDVLPHIPILKEEIVSLFQPMPGKTFIDMTFGAGGHSTALLKECPTISIIALDRDKSALKHGKKLQNVYGRESLQLLHGSFTDILHLLEGSSQMSSGIADGVLFDVGASSMQYNNRKRGFALKTKGPLDMRMNSEENIPTASDVINKLEEKDLYKILRKYGEEKRARQIARQMVEHRQMMGPILTTRDLQDLVAKVYSDVELADPTDKIGRKQHPATLTFQALRIFVNDELNQLYNGLKIAHRLLKPMGICAAITFHSLEHNIVHQVFNTSHVINKQQLITPQLHKTAQFYTWKCNRTVMKPTAEEIAENPRSRSAELRVAYKRSIQY